MMIILGHLILQKINKHPQTSKNKGTLSPTCLHTTTIMKTALCLVVLVMVATLAAALEDGETFEDSGRRRLCGKRLTRTLAFACSLSDIEPVTHPTKRRSVRSVAEHCCFSTLDRHYLFDILTMNNYVPVRKIIKIVSAQRNPRLERRSSLQDCFDSPGARRRSRCNPWMVLFFLLSAVIYVYCHRAHYLPPLNGRIFFTKIRSETPNGKIKIAIDATQMKKPPVLPLAKPNTAVTVETTTRTQTTTSGDFYKSNLLKPGSDIKPRVHPAVRDLPVCFMKKPYPKFELKMKSINLDQENIYPMVTKGGSYHPADCKSKFKVGIIVPYRERVRNLGIFLNNIHPFLMRQKLDYQIFVIEQHGTELFNKGRLLNAGFNEMMKFNTFHCVVFHDLDLLPMHESILYSCPTLPRHMCARVNDTEMRKYDQRYKFHNLFGGVVSMTRDQFERANGFSNLYFGWGGEDNDLFWRLIAAGYPVVRYNSSVGVYLVLPHYRESANPFRHHLLSRAVERYRVDGLSDSEYYVVSTKFRPLCTHIVVNINPRDDNITNLNRKWSEPGYKFH
ncbi:hypothetical protein PYW08_004906 [Mythimna loreyi]|uniref:Uncharacterized protein n=1 Tax=Mythimna loreyi TaxID=667449 RepID=A0ACC2QE19_9NEOP|nr:hypothetical protein PYW08_004906 [Mythimna loreyi]